MSQMQLQPMSFPREEDPVQHPLGMGALPQLGGQGAPPVGGGVLPQGGGQQVLQPAPPAANGQPGVGAPAPNPAQQVALDWVAEQARVALYLDNAIAQENNQASLYCPSRDYQHLLVCRYGQVSTKLNDLDFEINTINPRDTVPEKQHADTCIHTGLKSSGVTQQLSAKTLSSVKPTCEEANVETRERNST